MEKQDNVNGNPPPRVQELRALYRVYAVRLLAVIVLIAGTFGALVGMVLAMFVGKLWLQILLAWLGVVILWQALMVRADTDEHLDEIWCELTHDEPMKWKRD